MRISFNNDRTSQERDDWLEALETAIAEMKTRRYSYETRQHNIPEVDLLISLSLMQSRVGEIRVAPHRSHRLNCRPRPL